MTALCLEHSLLSPVCTITAYMSTGHACQNVTCLHGIMPIPICPFARYMQLLFDYSGVPLGGRVTNYLLEKTRDVAPAQDERSFHIFYQLLAGASAIERSRLQLSAPAEAFCMLSRSGCVRVRGTNDKDEFVRVRGAMAAVGFSAEAQHDALRLVAAILWLGNLCFEPPEPPTRAKGSTISPYCRVAEPAASLASASELLGVIPAALEGALTHRTLTMQAHAAKTIATHMLVHCMAPACTHAHACAVLHGLWMC